MNIYIDESGSINNHIPNNPFFVIALIRVTNKDGLKRAYKRFVSSNYNRLIELDKDKIHPKTGKVIKEGGKMFLNGNFQELKGSQLDKEMKKQFVEFFSRKPNFEIYYIKISNNKLTDHFCQNTARVFNYTLKLALEYFINKGYLPNEDCVLQLDERNEKTETKFFLENYLNTELSMNGTATGKFDVSYFDSANNNLVQIADVFANLFYSHLQTGGYEEEFQKLKDSGILKFTFEFPK
ncbi:MAG: DUF3800 domain-containing protein [Lachnospiraceae bacterium]|nr:DUF3800 domain-containing protein [Lachnospiraceae bacterium]